MSERPDSSIGRWIEERTGAGSWMRGMREAREPAAANHWLSLGGVLVLLLVLQALTGVLLLVYFVPSPEQAFESVERIMRQVPFGWWIRLLHVHGANLLVGLLFIHLGLVALMGAYKRPREGVWLVGCLLLLSTLAMALSGYILPWSQVSYWASTVVTATLDLLPIGGHELMIFARGGEAVGPPTFRRAFLAHVVLLPAAIVLLLFLHIKLIRRFGLSTPPQRGPDPDDSGPMRAFFPDFAIKFAILFTVCLLLLVAGVIYWPNIFFPVDHASPANPFVTPDSVKPEWFFLWAYALPRLVPEWIAMPLQGLAIATLFALPFLDRSPLRHPLDRPVVTASLLATVAAMVVLTIIGWRA